MGGGAEPLEKPRNHALGLGERVVVVVTRVYPDLPAYSTMLFTTVFPPSQGGTGCGSAHKPSPRLCGYSHIRDWRNFSRPFGLTTAIGLTNS
jgi:hypothetical protein